MLALLALPGSGATIDVMGQTVVVVDDDPGFRSLVGRLLNASGFDVVGDAADGEEALTVTRRLHPDIVLLDVQMPGKTGSPSLASFCRNRPPWLWS